MEERNTDFCELTSEELDDVLGGNGATRQSVLIVKAQPLHAAQQKFEE